MYIAVSAVNIFPRNVNFREYYVFVSNPAAASQFRCQHDTFLKDFKLRSSNLTHALFIQISRTSSIIDIVENFKKIIKIRMDLKMATSAPQVTSKVNFGHQKMADRSENGQKCNQK